MSENTVVRRVLGINVFIYLEREDGILFAKGFCPESGCEHSDDSADNGFDQNHAADTTAGKLRTHLILSHGYKPE